MVPVTVTRWPRQPQTEAGCEPVVTRKGDGVASAFCSFRCLRESLQGRMVFRPENVVTYTTHCLAVSGSFNSRAEELRNIGFLL